MNQVVYIDLWFLAGYSGISHISFMPRGHSGSVIRYPAKEQIILVR